MTVPDKAVQKLRRMLSQDHNILITEKYAREELERAVYNLQMQRFDQLKNLLPPIERDESYDRTYIPLPGGWEIQTKGKGSSYRICNTKTGDRLNIPDSPYLRETLTEMALAVHEAVKNAIKSAT